MVRNNKMIEKSSSKDNAPIIISLGGSIIIPEEINVEFLKSFKELIVEYLNKGSSFIIVCGGGRTARKYQGAAREFNIDNENLDWIGIYATYINAVLVKSIFQKEAISELATNPTKKIKEKLYDKKTKKGKVLIATGWKPGCSTDHDAVLLAKNFGARTVINLSDLDYVYDKDPKKFPDAKPLKKISWNDMRKITGEKWIPGKNIPFDPVATGEASKLKMKVAIMNKDLNNLRKFLDNEEFKGTVIE